MRFYRKIARLYRKRQSQDAFANVEQDKQQQVIKKLYGHLPKPIRNSLKEMLNEVLECLKEKKKTGEHVERDFGKFGRHEFLFSKEAVEWEGRTYEAGSIKQVGVDIEKDMIWNSNFKHCVGNPKRLETHNVLRRFNKEANN